MKLSLLLHKTGYSEKYGEMRGVKTKHSAGFRETHASPSLSRCAKMFALFRKRIQYPAVLPRSRS
jgi:hypothetical protein